MSRGYVSLVVSTLAITEHTTYLKCEITNQLCGEIYLDKLQ